MQAQVTLTGKSPSESNDAALWETIIAGDEKAYAKFVRKYSRPLFNYGYRLCSDRDFLKDCIQDLFVEIWNRKEKMVVGEKFKWYLFKSLRNSIFREQTKFSRNEPLPEGYHFMVEFDVEHQQIINESERELIFKVKQTLDYLPARQKEVLYLRYFEALTFDDIAEIMEISKQSSHNLLQKAYKSFREKWETSTHPSVSIAAYSTFLSLIINHL